MRRIALLVALLAATLGLGLAGPPPAAACVGCATQFKEFVDGNSPIVLARYRGRSVSGVLFDVIDVLKGTSMRTLLFRATDTLPGPQPSGRWLLAPQQYRPVGGVVDCGVMADGFRVGADGTVTNAQGGEGAVVGYPRTLAGWYRALGLRPPDTSTAAEAPVQPAPGPALPATLLLAAALAGAGAALRRQRAAARP